MPTDLENLQSRRSVITAELAALSSTAAGGKPNAAAAGIDHVGYKDGLYRELKQIQETIAMLGGEDDGPWMLVQPMVSG